MPSSTRTPTSSPPKGKKKTQIRKRNEKKRKDLD
jgi:hypothetical protein